ncbi:DNA-binding protein [Amniculicola lignicola CBS 123094]|uniref:DNA-binding protein n=1 Tax=Amniculicola lignicola CBS 123094 TaxID=1392246 RepID=A0A6A5W6B0_9PLEO|nr:DNA-binding protein [Amniculicola lignicola CBS 123094]
MPQTYNTTLTHFTNFLTAYTHTLLHLRGLYPSASFTRSRFHNTPVYQSRHPSVCEWITDAINAVRDELLLGTVARIGVVIFSMGTGSPSAGEAGTAPGGPKILERFMLDVSRFPVVEKGERNTEIEWEAEGENSRSSSSSDNDDDNEGSSDEAGPNPRHAKAKAKAEALDADVDVDLSEQFRAAFITLTTRCSQLSPLPKDCSFNISMELKDSADIDPPIRHPQPWIPVQPNLQKTGRKGAQEQEDRKTQEEGQDLGGVKVTPIRAVEVGVFRFETWVEEGRAKFEMENKAKSSFASSGG